MNFCLCQAEAGLQIQDLRSKKQRARCGPACEGCEGEAGDGIKGKGEDSEVNDPSGEAGQRQGGKKVSRTEKEEISVAEERNEGPKTHARVLARRSTSEWAVEGKTKCFVGQKDVVKKEPMTFVQVIKDEAEKEEEDEEVAEGEVLMAAAGEKERDEEASPVAAQGAVGLSAMIGAEEMGAVEPDEEVTVICTKGNY